MKIALCIPVHGGAEPRFVQCLSRMIAHTLGARMIEDGKPVAPQIETFVYSSSIIAFSRRKLAQMALDWDAVWLLWLDADQTFPPDALLRLLARRKAFIGANYRRRDADTVLATAYRMKAGKFDPVLPAGDGIEEVMHLGLGLCLTHADVFRKIDQPYFFDEMRPDGMTMIGEDVNFCRKARAAGVPVFVDHGLSREVGHMTRIDLRFPDTQ